MTSLILFILLQVADVVTTLMALHKGAREANPVVRWLMGRFGTIPAMVGSKALVTFLLAVYSVPQVFWMLDVMLLLVVLNNLYVIRKA